MQIEFLEILQISCLVDIDIFGILYIFSKISLTVGNGSSGGWPAIVRWWPRIVVGAVAVGGERFFGLGITFHFYGNIGFLWWIRMILLLLFFSFLFGSVILSRKFFQTWSEI